MSEELGVALKQGMRNLASGVCVVTALTESGERVAMTASSVTSVSDNPASLLVCVNTEASLDTALKNTPCFCVNVLSKAQEAISNNCASPAEGDSRFQLGDWEVDNATGLSYLRDALSVFLCRKQKVVSYGTHNIYIGDVSAVFVADSECDILVYAKGAYHYI